MKKHSKQNQRLPAIWAADCTEHILPFFKEAYPKYDRPHKTIETRRKWVRTDVFKMSEIRGASLAAHAAAREAKEKNGAVCFAARASGQAVATAHVPQHAFGAAYYALKAVAVSEPVNAETKIAGFFSARAEGNWITKYLPENLRQEFLNRIIVQKRGDQFSIK